MSASSSNPRSWFKVREGEADEQRVVGTKPPSQRFAELGKLCPQPSLGQLCQRLGVALPGDQRLQHRPTRGAQHLSGDRVDLMPTSASATFLKFGR
jgi:hypothetical protein